MTRRDTVPAGDATTFSSSSSGIRVRPVTTAEELEGMATAWGELLRHSATVTPFMTHAWVTSWWRAFGADRQLHILVLEDDHGPCGLAPLTSGRRRLGPLSYRSLELVGTGPLPFLGMGLADRVDLLLARRRDACLDALFGHLASHRDLWDIVDLRFVPEDSLTAESLRRDAGRLGLGIATTTTSLSPYLPLEGTYDAYLKGRSSNFRSGLKRKLKKLEAAGRVTFELDAGHSDPAAALAAAVDVSRRSWKELAGSALLLNAGIDRFLGEVFERLGGGEPGERGEPGETFIAFLHLDDRPIAHELGFVLDDRMWFYDHSYDQEFARFSPGQLLTARLLERAWQDGLVEYDFLRGDEPYKLSWTDSSRRELQLVLDDGSVRGRSARALAYEGKWKLKQSDRLVRAQARVAGWLNRRREPADASGPPTTE